MASVEMERTKRKQVLVAAVILCVLGVPLAGLGAVGVIASLEGPRRYDLQGKVPETADPVLAQGAVCRFEARSQIPAYGRCVAPLFHPDAANAGFDRSPLLYMADCITLGLLKVESKDKPRLDLIGKVYPVSVYGDAAVAHVKQRYPGFSGEIMEAYDPTEDQESRMIFAAMAAAGVALFAGGLVGGRIAYRGLKRLESA